MNAFRYRGIQSSAYGLYCSGQGTFKGAAISSTKVAVPGRNGDLIISNGRHENILIEYPAFVMGDAPQRLQHIRNWLLGAESYARLEDDYDPLHYRMAIYSGEIDPQMWPRNMQGEILITFDCKPQRFLLSGEEAVQISASGGTIANPTPFEALPLLKIMGAAGEEGTLAINGTLIRISEIQNNMIIDTASADAYRGGQNLNQLIYAPSMPKLQAGENTIEFTGGITAVDIVPRWWEL